MDGRMTEMCAQTRVLCLGHSYIKHFQHFVYNKNSGSLFINDNSGDLTRFAGPLHNLFLSEDDFSIYFDGVSGATIYPPSVHLAKPKKNKSVGVLFNNSVDFFEPHIVFLQIGSNDLCDAAISPEAIAQDIVSYAEYILETLHVCYVIIGEVVPRLVTFAPEYNERVFACNRLLKRALVRQAGRHREEVNPRISLAPHAGLHSCDSAMYASDGIHLSARGNMRLVRSIRGGVIRAYKSCLRQGFF